MMSSDSPAAPKSPFYRKSQGLERRNLAKVTRQVPGMGTSAEMRNEFSRGGGHSEMSREGVTVSALWPHSCLPSPQLPFFLKQPLLSQQKGFWPRPKPHGHFDLGDQLLPQSCGDLTSKCLWAPPKDLHPAHCCRETCRAVGPRAGHCSWGSVFPRGKQDQDQRLVLSQGSFKSGRCYN